MSSSPFPTMQLPVSSLTLLMVMCAVWVITIFGEPWLLPLWPWTGNVWAIEICKAVAAAFVLLSLEPLLTGATATGILCLMLASQSLMLMFWSMNFGRGYGDNGFDGDDGDDDDPDGPPDPDGPDPSLKLWDEFNRTQARANWDRLAEPVGH